jgi:hypothetical protein
MQANRRFQLLLAALVAVFVLGIALALGGLLAMHDPGTLAVFAVATLAGVAAAGITYVVARSSIPEPEDAQEVLEPEPGPAAQAVPQPLRPVGAIEALPVASLPAPYLSAVMKGLHANRRALSHDWESGDKQAGA